MDGKENFLRRLPWWAGWLLAGLCLVLGFTAEFFTVGVVPGSVFALVFKIMAAAFFAAGVFALARHGVAALVKRPEPAAPAPEPEPAAPPPPPKPKKPSDPRRFMHPAMRAELDAQAQGKSSQQ